MDVSIVALDNIDAGGVSAGTISSLLHSAITSVMGGCESLPEQLTLLAVFTHAIE